MDLTIGNRFRLEEPLECGKDVRSYKAYDMQTGETVMMRILNDPRRFEKFVTESKILKLLSKHDGFPTLFYDDLRTEGQINVIVTNYFTDEQNILKLFHKNKKNFAIESVTLIAVRLIERLKLIHSFGIIHNNINPMSFVWTNDDIILNDFSAAAFNNSSPGNSPRTNLIGNSESLHKKFLGTFKYASINSHYGRVLGKNDDLESLAYSLIYLARGRLPWSGHCPVEGGGNAEKNTHYLRIKKNTPIEQICLDIPDVFAQFLTLVKNLDNNDEPDYDLYIKMFSQCTPTLQIDDTLENPQIHSPNNNNNNNNGEINEDSVGGHYYDDTDENEEDDDNLFGKGEKLPKLYKFNSNSPYPPLANKPLENASKINRSSLPLIQNLAKMCPVGMCTYEKKRKASRIDFLSRKQQTLLIKKVGIHAPVNK